MVHPLLGRLRLAVAAPRLCLHAVLGTAIIAFLFPFSSRQRRNALVRWWSHRLLTIAGVRLKVLGLRGALLGSGPEATRIIDAAMRPGGIGAMLVLNHISWADIFAVHALRPARFVAKSEMRSWPVVGYLTAKTGTIFIERGRRRAVRDANQRIARLLGEGELTAMFPEGTTGDGDRLLPFHANLIQPAIEARAPIIVAGLRYLDAAGRPSTLSSYAGDLTLVQSVARTVLHGPFTVELHLIDAIDGAATTRHAAARRARAAIAASLGFDDAAEEALEEISTVIIAPDDRSRDGRREDFSQDAVLLGMGPETVLDPRDELL